MNDKERAFNQSIGCKIMDLRKLKKHTLQETARYLGVTFQQIQKYESGTNAVSLFKLLKLCVFFQEPITVFLSQKQLCLNLLRPITLEVMTESERLGDKDVQPILDLMKMINNRTKEV